MNNQTTNSSMGNNPTEKQPLKKVWQEPKLIDLSLNTGAQIAPGETQFASPVS